MMASIDIAGLATKTMMDGLWKAQSKHLVNDALPLEKVEELIKGISF